MKLKLALVVMSGTVLMSFAACGRLLLDVMYMLPQFSDTIDSLTGTSP